MELAFLISILLILLSYVEVKQHDDISVITTGTLKVLLNRDYKILILCTQLPGIPYLTYIQENMITLGVPFLAPSMLLLGATTNWTRSSGSGFSIIMSKL